MTIRRTRNLWLLVLPWTLLSPLVLANSVQTVSMASSALENPGHELPESLRHYRWDESELRYHNEAPESREPQSLHLGTSRQSQSPARGEHWQFGLDFDAILTPEQKVSSKGPGQQTHQQDLGVERFLLSGHSERLSFRMGHHQAAEQGLLFSGESHWGVSAKARLEGINSQLSVFGVNAAPGEGLFEGLARADSEDFFSGGSWQSSLDTPWAGMTFSAAYVSGHESGDVFQGDSLADTTGLGEGYSLGLESQWFDRQLSLELESAMTRFNPEHGRAERRPSDTAYTATLVYQPQHDVFPVDWELGAQTQAVGHQFYSPANQSLDRDRLMERYFMRLNPAGSWTLGYSYRQEATGLSQGRPSVLGDQLFAEATFRLSNRIQLKPTGQFRRERLQSGQGRMYQSFVSLTANTWLIPDSLFYRKTIRFNRTDGTDHPALANNERHGYLAGEFRWQAITPGRVMPGLDVNLSFSADRTEAERYQDSVRSDYQMLLSINSRLPGV